MIFIALLITMYLMIGLVYSRKRYATLAFERKAALPTPTEKDKAARARIAVLDENTKELSAPMSKDPVVHGVGCGALGFHNADYRKQWCNCGVYKKLQAIDRERRELKMGVAPNGEYKEPEKYLPVVFWFAYMAGDFVSSGTPADSEAVRRAKEIAEATHAADMAEIRARESAALDRELEASKR